MNIRLFQVKNNKLQEWLSWCEELKKPQVKKLLDEENIDEITNHLLTLNNQHYVIYSVRTQGKNVDYDHPFNKKHYAKKKDCLVPCSDPEMILKIERESL